MELHMKISKAVQELLCCPICYSKLKLVDSGFVCVNSECDIHFPIVDGIPVLINEKESVFTIDDFLLKRDTYLPLHKNRCKQLFHRASPTLGLHIKAKRNYEKFAGLLLNQSNYARVLVIGGSILGRGMKSFVENQSLEIVESDILFGTRTNLICDAHNIPFEDNTFDGVIAQVVLEHVVDPYKCVEEIYRILKIGGLVYAETPFIQQVHGGRYDFTRFTYLGHRRLFRRFDEIEHGTACGAGTALAWSYKYFLLSFTSWRPLRSLIDVFAIMTSFYLKYFDYFLINKRATLDAASAYYFMGCKRNHVLSDRELIQLYKGAV